MPNGPSSDYLTPKRRELHDTKSCHFNPQITQSLGSARHFSPENDLRVVFAFLPSALTRPVERRPANPLLSNNVGTAPNVLGFSPSGHEKLPTEASNLAHLSPTCSLRVLSFLPPIWGGGGALMMCLV